MTIIKNLIRRNHLRRQLYDIEKILQTDGYYDKQKQLTQLHNRPDDYAELYIYIRDTYGELINTKNAINKQLNDLSGVNIFKKQNEEFYK